MQRVEEMLKGSLSAGSGSQVIIPGTESWNMRSELSGREFRIMVSIPEEAAPEAGYPVLYVLDGDACFGTAAEAVRLLTRKPHGYDSAIVVGLSYPSPLVPGRERFFDYTMPANPDRLPKRGDGSPWPPIGGADEFLYFMEKELKPAVEERYTVDRSRQGLFGHSLGGFFVLHALFTRRHDFQTYIAGSPSIWWNDRMLLEEERVFVQELESIAGTDGEMRLFIAVGELEGGHRSRIFEDSSEMAQRLAGLEGKGLQVHFKEYEGDGHVSVIPSLIGRGIRIALSKSKEERGRII
jgi:uncharacterized protein